MDNEGRGDRFIGKLTYIPHRIYNNPSGTSCHLPLHKGGNQFKFLALPLFLTNCKALFSIFLLEVAELNMLLRKRQLTFDALRDCRADRFCQLQQGFLPFCGLALALCNLLNSANGHSNSYLFTIVS